MRPLTTSQAGVATYCRGLLRGFANNTHGIAILLYAKESPPPDVVLGSAMAWRAMPARLWLPIVVPSALHAGRVALFHGTNHMAPPWGPVPTVLTVHDLSALTMPQHHTWRNRLLSVPQMLLSLHRAARLIADSTATARDLAALPGIKSDRIRVIPLAAAPGLTPTSPLRIREMIRGLELPETFFLFVGALEPRKNVVTLVRALAAVHATGHREVHLVIAGAAGWRNDDVAAEVHRLGLESIVRYLGYIPDEDLAALYGAATAFVYPSLFEGFGLPPLEAMACGTPVITSNVSSLPEVVGDAALLINPRSVEDLAAAMRAVLDDEALRARLRAAGLARAALFSWERTARETLAVYRETLAEGRARHP